MKLVDNLEISTAYILKAIIDECNIREGSVRTDVEHTESKIQIISFDDMECKSHQELKDYIISNIALGESVMIWLQKVVGLKEGSNKIWMCLRNIQLRGYGKVDCYIQYGYILRQAL